MRKLTPAELREKAEKLDNWTLLDSTLWSCNPEFETIVENVFNELRKKPGFASRPNVRKKHLTVLLLNLHKSWCADPAMYVGYHRGNDHYSKRPKRYNPNAIKHTLVAVVDAMIDAGYLENVAGHYFRGGGGNSHVSRMRPTQELVNLFTAGIGTSALVVQRSPNTECIILRDLDPKADKQVEVDYSDTTETIRMRRDLTAYNNLLRTTFIDIPFYPATGIPTKSGTRHIFIDRTNKFVRRIFNNGSWDAGGRFYGGWWQRIPKEWREKIKINGLPVVEIDYSGLHIVILYATEGIDYWKTDKKDPYSIPHYVKSDEMRRLLKLVLLAAINAADKITAVKAVRSEINADISDWGWVNRNGLKLEKVVDDFADRHVLIRKHFFSGSGIKLQKIDSIMAEHVINKHTELDVPILCVHDSFIVMSVDEARLRETMQDAFKSVITSLFGHIKGLKSNLSTLGITEKTFIRHWTPELDHLPPPPISSDERLRVPSQDPEFDRRFNEHINNPQLLGGVYGSESN
jgi:hypothetical protein